MIKNDQFFICGKLVSEYRIWSKKKFIQTIWENFERARPYSLNPNRCFLYYAKNSNDQPVIQRAEFLPSNKISPRVIFQIQIFKTYEFHKDSYASHARIQHNNITFH